ICVALSGASLSVAGAAMQGLLKNPLADGSTLGVSSGASLGAALAIVLEVSFPWLPFASTMVMARKQRAVYSQGPMAKAKSATFSASRPPMMALKKVPKKEAVIPMAKALLAWPFFAMGWPSQQVATAEAEPGMPRSTDPIKAPEQPPIHRAKRKMMAVEESMV
ncbi:MAG: iron chelate uptake ABC transporter family permease subunit, partial [Blautia sp.]|nr:iron chelate uptake ABC transporter family permease subunit [Blautia sp.]